MSEQNANFYRDSNYYRYVGWQETAPALRQLFSYDNIKKISYKITQLLRGLIPNDIIVPDESICSILSNIQDNYREQTGDIYGRYNIPNNNPISIAQDMEDQTIETIVSQIRSDYAMRANNAKLTAWTMVYGDFNNHGLRQHSIIKIQEKRPNPMEFNMNY
jgi:hypothetical protein